MFRCFLHYINLFVLGFCLWSRVEVLDKFLFYNLCCPGTFLISILSDYVCVVFIDWEILKGFWLHYAVQTSIFTWCFSIFYITHLNEISDSSLLSYKPQLCWTCRVLVGVLVLAEGLVALVEHLQVSFIVLLFLHSFVRNPYDEIVWNLNLYFALKYGNVLWCQSTILFTFEWKLGSGFFSLWGLLPAKKYFLLVIYVWFWYFLNLSVKHGAHTSWIYGSSKIWNSLSNFGTKSCICFM